MFAQQRLTLITSCLINFVSTPFNILESFCANKQMNLKVSILLSPQNRAENLNKLHVIMIPVIG